MSFTVAKVSGDYAHLALGNMYGGLFDLTFSNSYATGGEPIAASDVGLRKLLGMQFIGGNAASGKLYYGFDTTNLKVIAWCPTGGAAAPTTLAAPAAAQGALSGVPAVGTLAVTTTPDAGGVTMTGSAAKPALAGVITGALTAGSLALANPALTAGIAKEIGNTTDLSTITIRVLVYGN